MAGLSAVQVAVLLYGLFGGAPARQLRPPALKGRELMVENPRADRPRHRRDW